MLFEEAKEHMEAELEEKLKTAEEQEAKEQELDLWGQQDILQDLICILPYIRMENLLILYLY